MQQEKEVKAARGRVRAWMSRVRNCVSARSASPRRIHRALCLLLVPGIISELAVDLSAKDRHEKIPVFVSILPQAYFVERIGGEYVEVDVLVGPGQSPATYEPTPRQMARLSEAELFFTIGVPFEKHLLKKISATMHDLSVIEVPGDLLDSTVRESAVQFGSLENHGHDQRHYDPHIWLDPNLAKRVAQSICRELITIDPAHKQRYKANFQDFESDLDSVDALISKRLAPFAGRKFYVFHPAFGHFGRAYNLIQVSIEHEGKEPTPKQLAELIDQTRKENVKVIVVQEQFSTREAQAVAEYIGATILQLDPLAKDYLSNLVGMAEALAGVLAMSGGQ